MSNLLFRLGRSSAAHPWRVVAAWIFAAATILMLNSSIGGETDETFRLPGADSQRAADVLAERFPDQTLFTSNVVFHAPEGVTAGETEAAIDAAVERLADGAHVVSVSDPFDARAPTTSEDGTTAFATVGYDVERVTPAMYDEAEAATSSARDAGVRVEYDGSLGYASGDEGGGGELIAVLVAAIVLVIAFRSVVATGLPIGVALVAILIGTSALGVLAGLTAVPKIATVIGLMLALGVGIDYALIIVTRHRQNLATGMSVPRAAGLANATAGLSVVFAGATVILAILGVQVSGIPMLAMMGWGAATMVAVTVLAAVTLLPALLGVVGHRVDSLRIPFVRRRPVVDTGSTSARWVTHVLRHPVGLGLVSALVLVALAVPAFSMRLAFADAGNDPAPTTTRKAYDLMADAYGPGSNGPLWIVLESDAEVSGDLVDRVAGAAGRTAGVASVTPPVFNDDREVAVLVVTPTSAPQDEKTSELLSRLRHTTLPAAVGDGGVEAFVTGGTALGDDVSTQLQQRMPYFVGAVIGLSFLILTVVFRSVLVPLKAAVLNLLGVGASYGVVVAVFQWGWGASLIGVHEALPIMPLAPMLMFAILFGLSMDYEVFLLSRVREQFLVHGDARRAVVEGVGATGRVITSAALIMVAVFSSFVLGADPTTKMFGVGLAVAVLLDVTLVRMVLVPAVMGLFGATAWWLPRWLDRMLPRTDSDAGGHAPDREVSAVALEGRS